eukprot:RCo023117
MVVWGAMVILLGGGSAASVSAPGQLFNDVWASPDGSGWTALTFTAGFPGRSAASAVVLANTLWVVGGLGATGPLGDVWSSEDGILFMKNTAAGTFGPRHSHTSVVIGSNMYIIGGSKGMEVDSTSELLGDIWIARLESPTDMTCTGAFCCAGLCPPALRNNGICEPQCAQAVCYGLDTDCVCSPPCVSGQGS